MQQKGFSEFNILITDHVHPLMLDAFDELEVGYSYQPHITRDEVLSMIHRFDGIVINTKIKADKALIDAANELRFIARLGSGLDIIDLEYAAARHIEVINSPEGNRNAVAEHMMGMLLSLTNKLCSGQKEVLQDHWDREFHRGIEIEGMTVGIYGCGHTGSSFAKKLRGFDVRVLVFDKYKERFGDALRFADVVSQSEIIKKSDILSFHLPLTIETYHLVDQNFLADCRQGVIILNSSRGAVVKTSALLKSLKTGKVAGAALDVFENENPKSWTESERRMYLELMQMPQVVCSPHVAGWTVQSKQKIAKVLLAKLADIYGLY